MGVASVEFIDPREPVMVWSISIALVCLYMIFALHSKRFCFTQSCVFLHGELSQLLALVSQRTNWRGPLCWSRFCPSNGSSFDFILSKSQVVSILRAGLALVEHASSILPATKTYHLGEKKTLFCWNLRKLKKWKTINLDDLSDDLCCDMPCLGNFKILYFFYIIRCEIILNSFW